MVCGTRLFIVCPAIASVVDAAVRGRVNLDDVEVLALADRDALLARATGLSGRTLLAVDHLGQDPGGRGLAGSARSAEQERVGETPLANRAGERPHDVVLPEDLVRALGAVLPVERLVRLVVGQRSPPVRWGKPTGR